jgi:hypothetical protein
LEDKLLSEGLVLELASLFVELSIVVPLSEGTGF